MKTEQTINNCELWCKGERRRVSEEEGGKKGSGSVGYWGDDVL
jgi:hypothetical protein